MGILKPVVKQVLQRLVKKYNRNFKELNFETQLLPANYFTTFPAVTTVNVKKKR